MNNTLAFDIETVPDVAYGRRLHDLGELPDEQVAKAMFALRRQDRRLGYGLINAGRNGREYREREAAQWLDRIHAPRHGRRVRDPDSFCANAGRGAAECLPPGTALL